MTDIDTIIRVPKKAEVKYERRWVRLSELKKDLENPNIMSERQRDALSLSVSKWGYVYEIVVDKTTMIIADGEHRVDDLISKGITEAEVILFPFKDDAERRLFRQSMNKIGGRHSEELDLKEYNKIIEAGLKTDLTGLLGMTEKEMDRTLSQLNEPDKKEDKPTDVVVCPKCGENIVIGFRVRDKVPFIPSDEDSEIGVG